jgi:hypothetical protein
VPWRLPASVRLAGVLAVSTAVSSHTLLRSVLHETGLEANPFWVITLLNNFVIVCNTLKVRFEALTAGAVKNAIFWDVMMRGSCKKRSFGGTYRLFLQGRRNNIMESVRRWITGWLQLVHWRHERALGGEDHLFDFLQPLYLGQFSVFSALITVVSHLLSLLIFHIIFSTLKKGPTRSSETPAHNKPTRRHIPNYCTLHLQTNSPLSGDVEGS